MTDTNCNQCVAENSKECKWLYQTGECLKYNPKARNNINDFATPLELIA